MKTATCEQCQRTLPIAGSVTATGEELGFRDIFYDGRHARKQSQDTVAYTADPFQEEIYHDASEHWICESCWYQSYMDI